MKDETLLNHQPQVVLPEGNIPVVGPIYQSVKFTLHPWHELSQAERQKYYFYSREKNPTVRQLEMTLAQLQKCESGLAVASGIAAISCTLLSLLKSGDHMILFWESYKPSRHIVRSLLAKFGITFTFLSITDVGRLKSAIQPGKTKVIFFESPTNPMTRIADIDAITTVAHAHNILTVLDNTFAGPHNHCGLPIDIYIHSLTKFAGGHGDVLGGAILGRRELIEKIADTVVHVGPALDAHAAFLISRGLKTYFVRLERQCANALAIAEFLSRHPKVANVYYPGLVSHPDCALAQKQMKDFGAVVTFNLNNSFANTESFFRQLKLFHITASLGSTESLATPAKLFFACDLNEDELKIVGITERTVRLAIGIEAVEDLIADLDAALKA